LAQPETKFEGQMKKLLYNEWACFKDGIQNYKMMPSSRDAVHLGGNDWTDSIEGLLEEKFATSITLLLVLWGAYGVGKTHKLCWIEGVCHEESDKEQPMFRYFPLFLTLSNVGQKSTFNVVSSAVLDAFTRQEFQALLMQRPDVFDDLCEDAGLSKDTKKAMANLLAPHMETVSQEAAWSWLTGVPVKDSHGLLDIRSSCVSRAHDLASIIDFLGRLVQICTEKKLLLLIDECENFGKSKQVDAASHMREGLRDFLDRGVDLIMTIGAERLEGFPEVILQPDIVRRIQKDMYVELPSMPVHELTDFVRELLAHVTDSGKLASLAGEESLAENSDFDDKLFPFSKSGFDEFCDQLGADPREAKASVVIDKVNRCAWAAYKRYKRDEGPSLLISPEVVDEVFSA
jgi:hypothetical protein